MTIFEKFNVDYNNVMTILSEKKEITIEDSSKIIAGLELGEKAESGELSILDRTVDALTVSDFVSLFSRDNIIAIIVFSISGITDILDGTIARKFDFISDFGKLMDPLADKLTQLSMLLMLTVKKIIPLWIVVVVFIKEFCMQRKTLRGYDF